VYEKFQRTFIFPFKSRGLHSKKSHHNRQLTAKGHLTGTAMAAELLIKHTIPDSTAPKMGIISHCQTIGQLIALIARMQGVDVGRRLHSER
jgi:hypothetical protein